MRNLLTTLAELVGLGAVTAGAAWIYAPVGLIVGGASLMLLGYLAGREEASL